MTMFKEVGTELAGMFVGEKRLTIMVLAIVGAAGLLVDFGAVPPLIGGAVLAFGCALLLVESVCRYARAGSS